MTAENKDREFDPIRRSILILGGSSLIGSLVGLDAWVAWRLLDNIIPQNHEGGRAEPGAMAKIIWGENCIYGFETWADNFEGHVGGSMIYFSRLKGEGGYIRMLLKCLPTLSVNDLEFLF